VPAARTTAPSRADESDGASHRDERSIFQLYLNEIRATPLLTIEEEIELATRIKRGDAAARERMIKANLRLVVTIAFYYNNLGLSLLDLISEGNLGLIKAVERFDPTKGGKLSTYAAWWIKQSMKRALANQGKTIRLPVHLIDTISRMRKTVAALTEQLGREPDNEEIAIELQVPVYKIALLRTLSVRPASLDAALSDDADAGVLGDIVGDDNAVSPNQSLLDKGLRDDLRDMVASLDARSAEILKLRFGLNGEEAMTLEEIGRKFRITRERVRQLLNQSLKCLRRQLEQRDRLRSRDDVEAEERAERRAQVFREFLAQQAARCVIA
jgi:RNA polymerase primary sigma factor